VLASINTFIGHFHPVLVHLPIGFILAGLLLLWLSRKPKYAGLLPAIPVILFWGAVMATVSCITGYLLSMSDDYESNLVGWHQWMGIGVALLSWVLWLNQKRKVDGFDRALISIALFGMIIITGHLGGSLTHGSGYLSFANIYGSDSGSVASIKPLPNVQEAMAYQDVVKPILETKCYSCHGANKQKGKLRMDDSLALMKGGKDGEIIEPHDAANSEMIKRLLLPVDNEDHMPPKEKPQPTESQIALLHWWINNGAAFNGKVKDFEQPGKIKPMLLALQNAPEVKTVIVDVPSKAVSPGDSKAIEQLKSKGIVVMPVARNSNYLMVNFVVNKMVGREDLQNLSALKDQLVWLKMGNTNLSDSGMAVIAKLEQLTRLGIENTSITDKGLALLKGLNKLLYLNLVGTKVTVEGVMALKDIAGLHSIYLYQTNVEKGDYATLQKTFPRSTIDSGGYKVSDLPTDTIIVRSKK
jgi:uncharacterized membrane protein